MGSRWKCDSPADSAAVCPGARHGYTPSVEHEEQAERLEHEAEGMAEDSEKVGEHIEGTRREWKAKEEDRSVPGAQPEDDESESVAGAETDEELLSEEGGP